METRFVAEQQCIGTTQYITRTDATRLVIWPEMDKIINCEQGKAFFKETTANEENKTEFETIPDCGHVWHADGRIITDLIQARTREYLLEFN